MSDISKLARAWMLTFAKRGNYIAEVLSYLYNKPTPNPVITVTCTGSWSNINLTSPGSSLDGHTLASGDLVLLFNQVDPKQNGLYRYRSSRLYRDEFAYADNLYPGKLMYILTGQAKQGKYATLSPGTDISGNDNKYITFIDDRSLPEFQLCGTETTNATATTVWGGHLDTHGVVTLRVVMNVANADATLAGCYSVMMTYRRKTNGDLEQVGTTTSLHSVADSGLSGAGISLTDDGTGNFSVKVTGKSSTNLTWSGFVEASYYMPH